MEFTKDMQFALKAPEVKRAWVSENASPNPKDCQNCGGQGYLYLFLATGGPFNSPGSGKGLTSKCHDGKWWIGKTMSFECPSCAKTRPPVAPPINAIEPRLPYKDND